MRIEKKYLAKDEYNLLSLSKLARKKVKDIEGRVVGDFVPLYIIFDDGTFFEIHCDKSTSQVFMTNVDLPTRKIIESIDEEHKSE